MKTRQTAILAAAVILPVVGILLFRGDPAIPSSGLGKEVLNRSQRPSPAAREGSPRSGTVKSFKNFTDKAMNNGLKLSRTQADRYLESRNRDMESLLVVFRMTMDNALIEEALAKFPENPEVLLCALRVTEDPAKRLELLETFNRNDPENGLGYCLAARALMDLGRDQEAIAELSKSTGKPIDDFTLRNAQSDEEAYLFAGYSPLEAKTAALFGGSKPSLIQMGAPFVKKLDAFRQEQERAGNLAEAQSILDLQIGIGKSLQQGGTIVDSLVGMTYQRNAWRDIGSDDARAYLSELESRKDAMIGKSRQVEALMKDSSVPDSDWLFYMDRAKLFGEQAANDWMVQKHPGR